MWYLAACWNPNPRMCCQVRGVVRNFIWGGKDAPARAKVKWDMLALPTAQGGLGIIDPKTQSEPLLAKLLVLWRRTLEGIGEAQSRPVQAPCPRQRPQHPQHQLALCRTQTQKDPMLYVEKHSWSLAKCEAGFDQSRPNQRDRNPQVSPLRQFINPQHKRHPAWNRRLERRLRIRALLMLSGQGLVELRRQRMEKPLQTGDELPHLNQKMQGRHHRQHPLAPRRVHQPHTSRRFDE